MLFAKRDSPFIMLAHVWNRGLYALNHSLNDFRATSGGLCFKEFILDENGVALQDISVLLGHESVMTTEKIYIRRNRTAKASTINV